MIIENLGEEAQKKVIEWYVQGLTYEEIANRLNAEFPDKVIEKHNVRTFIERKKSASAKIIKEDEKYQKELLDQYFNTINQLNELNREMWKVFYEIREELKIKKTIKCPNCSQEIELTIKDYQTLLKYAEHLLHQIKHVDEILGRLKNKQLNITYNVVDLSKKLQIALPRLLKRLENDGTIKIIKKKLKKKLEEEKEVYS